MLQRLHEMQQEATQDKPAEWHTCRADLAFFIYHFVMIFNATEERWLPFDLWPAQEELIPALKRHRYQIVLKARQLGLTWLYLAYLLWRVVFYPAATVGLFSKTETEAIELLDFRLKGMYDRLPDWLRVGKPVTDNQTLWELPNGSRAMAFATTGGRSYTFSHVLVDEGDFQPNLPGLLSAVEPTISAGGQLMIISSSNKDEPMSRFKAIYGAAKIGANRYHHIFLPWDARPERTPEWYAEQTADSLANTGALDDLWGEYPATDTEALAARSTDKRIPGVWLQRVYLAMNPLGLLELAADADIPALPNLEIYRRRERGHRYAIGVDPAEGNPTSDPSALEVIDVETGEEVAALSGRFQPEVIAEYADKLGHYYNNAALMSERNNHGHSVILWWRHFSELRVLSGRDKRAGWLSSPMGKTALYDAITDAVKNQEVELHSFVTLRQLESIEGSTLRAPETMMDDRADAFALAQVGREVVLATKPPAPRQPTISIPG